MGESKGLLEQRIADYSVASPVEWAKEMDDLYLLLGPNSVMLNKLIDCANSQTNIDVLFS